MVYHYTSLEVLCKLLNECRHSGDKQLLFWASSAYAMNDPTEMQYGYSFLRSFFEGGQQCKADKILLEMMPQIDDYKLFSGDEKEYYLSRENTPFVISFSITNDNLPLWTLYADKGCGVCLGFDEEVLFEPSCDYSFFHAVAYETNEEESMKVLYTLASKIAMEVEEYSHKVNGNDSETQAKSLLNRICPYISAFIKTPNYNYEQEKRLMFLRNMECDEVHFRTTAAHNVVPYIEVPISKHSLKEVYLGSNILSDHNKQSIETLLHVCRINAEVKFSTVPFRIF